jgi:hypothetical protein
VVALTIATALCEIHTGHAVGEAMRSPAASTPRHRVATQAMAGVAACEDQMRLRAGGDAAPGVTALVR